ncbi:hypothetical protein XA68_15690 [Ophiocordyceps unilateralis]|uniref:NADP-dependent oxidoreductase domain-containing protein n=1 Tax=Ophiocordyceps unilateralis TaxID=268505 RepID=A0A2A9P7Y2_OPHUN|nr:hypothetical protein XA68_15690 [Ophiocordyceps unilateralis]
MSVQAAGKPGDAELVFGDFRNRVPERIRERLFVATKWCIFKPLDRTLSTDRVLSAVQERHRRLGGRAELLQFHWHDYQAKEYLPILAELVGMTESHPHLVSAIGLCNFDAVHTQQFSLIDSRPLVKMVPVCQKYGLKLLTYGSLCGGLLSHKWLDQQSSPEPYSERLPLSTSQRNYLDMINHWGSWTDFHSLLATISRAAAVHNVSIANVAIRWVLQHDAVGAVLVGNSLGSSSHCADNLAVFGWRLSDESMMTINALALGSAGERTDALFRKLGDCGSEYRPERQR